MAAKERLDLERREASASDEAFLCRLFVENAEAEFFASGWSREQMLPLLRMQFIARLRDWTHRFGGAPQVVLCGGSPVATIWLARCDGYLLVVDLAVDSSHRRRGIATQLLRDTQAAAEQARIPLHLTVSTRNPGAETLYRQLGFQVISEDSLTRSMVWNSLPL